MEVLVASVIGIVTPYLIKGAEEFAKSTGQAAFDGTKALVERLSRWWKNDPIASTAANSIKSDPEHYGKLLGVQLEHALKNDPSLANDLKALVDNLGPAINVIQKIDVGRGVTGADIGTLVSGQVNIDQDVRDGQNITGFKADRVGGK